MFKNSQILALILCLLLPISVSADQESNLPVGADVINQDSAPSRNIMTISPNNEYNIKIPALREATLQLSKLPNSSPVSLSYSATRAFRSCFMDPNDQSSECIQEATLHKLKQGWIDVSSEHLKHWLVLSNKHLLRSVKVTLSFHGSTQQLQGGETCHWLQVEKVYNQPIYAQNCFRYRIENADQQVQLVVQKEGLTPLHVKYDLCGTVVDLPQTTYDANRVIVRPDQIKQQCSGKQQSTLTLHIKTNNSTATSTSHSHKNQTTSAIIALDYPTHTLLLAQGIVSEVRLYPQQLPFKVFHYDLVDNDDTLVRVFSQGKVELYINIIKDEQDRIPTKQDYDLSSQAGFLFLSYYQPYLTVTKQQLEDRNCAAEDDCHMLIAVYLHEAQSATVIGVEATQTVSILRNGIMKHNFLPAHSMAYYSYSSPRKQTFFLTLSDNHQQCAIIYVADNEAPGPDNNILKTEGTRLVMEMEEEEYYFGVWAKKDCAYSIVVGVEGDNITYVERGRFVGVELGEGQMGWYLVKGGGEVLKILALRQYGEVEIYLNTTNLNELSHSNLRNLNVSSMSVKGQYPNQLLLNISATAWCTDCYYLVIVLAVKHTSATLFVGDKTTPVPLHQKRLNDYLPHSGDVTTINYFSDGGKEFGMWCRVLRGRIKVKVHYKGSTWQQQLESSQQAYRDKIDLQEKQEGLFGVLDAILALVSDSAIRVQVIAMQEESVYAIQLGNDIYFGESTSQQSEQTQSEQQSTQQGNILSQNVTELSNTTQTVQQVKQGPLQFKLIAGNQLYLPVTPNKSLIIRGFFTHPDEQILLSTDYSQKDYLSSIRSQLTLNHESASADTQIVQNIATITTPLLKNYGIDQAVPFSLTLTDQHHNRNGSGVWLTIMQAYNFAMLPPQTDTIVHNSFTFVTHTHADLILDVFSCKGQTNITYNSERQLLATTDPQSLDLVGLPLQPHAFRTSLTSTTFFQINSSLAVARWFPLNISNHIGTGYLDYQVGHIIYENTLRGLTLTFSSLRRVKDTPTILKSIQYTLYLSMNQESLLSACRCEMWEEQGILAIHGVVPADQIMELNNAVIYRLDKQKIIEHFGGKHRIFASIVTDAVLTNSQNLTQRYRFIYPVLQVGSENLEVGYFQGLSFAEIVSLTVLLTVALGIGYYLCSRKCLPMLGRLKNRVLVEEEGGLGESVPQNKVGTEAGKEMLKVPASSDRRGVNMMGELMDKSQPHEAQ